MLNVGQQPMTINCFKVFHATPQILQKCPGTWIGDLPISRAQKFQLVTQIFAEDPRVCILRRQLSVFWSPQINLLYSLEQHLPLPWDIWKRKTSYDDLQQRVRRIGAVTFCPVARHVSKHDSCSSLFLGSNQKDSNWYQDLGNGGQYAGIFLLSDPFFPIQILWGSQRRHLLHKPQIVFANVGQLVHHGFNNL